MPLTGYQKAISDLAHRLGLTGSRESEVYSRPEFQDFINQYFGQIPLPPGVSESQIVSRGGSYVDYRDAEGYIHRLERDLHGGSPTVGQVRETTTNRPGILPLPSQQQQTDLISQLLSQLTQQFNQPIPQPDISQWLAQMDRIAQQLQQPAQLQPLSDQNLALLNQMAAAQNAQLQQQFNQSQGSLIAQLYGQGVNQSSIANQAAADLLQRQGLVQQQALSDQAARQLGLQQFLTQQGQGNLALALQGLGQAGQLGLVQFTAGQQARGQTIEEMIQQVNNLLGLQTNRDIASSSLGLDFQKFLEQTRQFNVGSQLEAEKIRASERMAKQNRPSIFSTIAGLAGSLLAAPLTGGASLAGLGSIFGGGGSGQIYGAGSTWPQN